MYLGGYNSDVSRKEYARVVAELTVSPPAGATGGPARTVDVVLLALSGTS